MDRSFPSKQQYRPPRIDYGSKAATREVKIDDAVTNKLFITVEEGNIHKIKSEILNNRSSLLVRNESGESLLHTIIKTSNISNDKKTEIVKYLLEEKVNVMAYDNNNITPLHLACQYQLKDIIIILLKKGAKLDAVDNQKMTPLHYLVMGESTQCLYNKQNKIELEPLIKFDDEKKNIDIIKITASIIREINNDNGLIQIYLNFIKKIISRSGEIFYEEYNSIITDIQKQISDIISDKNSDKDTVKNEIRKLVFKLKDNFESLVKNKLLSTLKSMDIKQDNPDGWGPDGTNVRVLDNSNPKSVFEKINTTIPPLNFSPSIQAITESTINLNNNIFTIENSIGEIIYKCYAYHINKDVHPPLPPGIQPNQHIDVDVNKLIEAFAVLENTRLDGPGPLNLSYFHLYDLQLPFDTLFQLEQPLLFDDNINWRLYVPFNDFNNPETYRISLNRLSQDARTRYLRINPPPIFHITDDRLYDPRNLGSGNNVPLAPDVDNNAITSDTIIFNNVVRLMPPFVPQGQPAVPGDQDNIFKPLATNVFQYVIYHINVITQIKLYARIIQKYAQIVSYNLDIIEKRIRNEHYVKLDYIIHNLVISLINIISYLIVIESTINKIVLRFNTLKNYLDDICKQHSANNTYIFYLEYAVDDCNSIMKILNNLNINTIYSNVYTIFNQLNTTIDHINNKSFIKFVNLFYNQFGNNYEYNQLTEIFRNFFIKPIYKLQTIPASLSEYKKTINLTSDINKDFNSIKRTIFEKYITQINKNNYSSYIINNLVGNPQHNPPIFIPKLNDAININALVYDDPVQLTDQLWTYDCIVSPPRLGFAVSIEVNNLALGDPPMLKDNVGNAIIRNPDATLIGENQVVTQVGPINKNDVAEQIFPHIIGVHFDDFFKSLKHLIIRHVLIISHVKIGDPQDNDFKTFHNYINELYPQNRDKIYYMNIAKIADEALISFIKTSINEYAVNTSNNIATYGIPDQKFNNIYKLFIANKELVALPDKGFKIKLNKIGSILTLHPQLDITQRFLQQEQAMVKEPYIDKNIHPVIPDFGTTNEVTCYKIDISILEMIKDKYLRYIPINYKNINGDSPIFYAIKNQHIDLVKILINMNATVSKKEIANNNKITPIAYSKNNLINNLEKFSSAEKTLENIIDPFNINIYEKIRNNPIFKSNRLKYSGNIIFMVISMINNMFFIKASNYTNNWSYDNHTNLMRIMDFGEYPKYKIPLITYLSDRNILNDINDNIGLKNINVLQEKIAEIDNNINENNSKIAEYNNSLAGYDSEIKSGNVVNKQLLGANIQENRDLIAELQRKNQELTAEKARFKPTLDAAINNTFITNYDAYVGELNTYQGSINIVKLYNAFFTRLLNNNVNNLSSQSDFRTYAELWKIYKDQKIDNYTDIINLANLAFINNMENLNINNLDLIIELYEKIFLPFSNAYTQLPDEYNHTNYAMKEVIDIIAHSIKHTIMTSYYLLILKLLNKYQSSIITTQITDEKKIAEQDISNRATVDDIINSDILDYIFNKMPLILVKNITGIFDGDNDPDKNKTPEDLFAEVSNILSKSGLLQSRSEAASLFDSLDNTIKPYMVEYTNLYIKEIKQFVDSFMNYIKSNYINMKIYKLLLNKANKEKLKK